MCVFMFVCVCVYMYIYMYTFVFIHFYTGVFSTSIFNIMKFSTKKKNLKLSHDKVPNPCHTSLCKNE